MFETHGQEDGAGVLDPTDEVVIDLISPIRAAAGVFAVSAEGTAQRIRVRAAEYRDLLLDG